MTYLGTNTQVYQNPGVLKARQTKTQPLYTTVQAPGAAITYAGQGPQFVHFDTIDNIYSTSDGVAPDISNSQDTGKVAPVTIPGAKPSIIYNSDRSTFTLGAGFTYQLTAVCRLQPNMYMQWYDVKNQRPLPARIESNSLGDHISEIFTVPLIDASSVGEVALYVAPSGWKPSTLGTIVDVWVKQPGNTGYYRKVWQPAPATLRTTFDLLSSINNTSIIINAIK